MTWTRLDDGFEDHPKVAPLSDAAHRLWVRASCWSRKPENLRTQGFIPRQMLPLIGKGSATVKKLEKLAKELVQANGCGHFTEGLWVPLEEGGKLAGWQIHDWHKYGPPEGRKGPQEPPQGEDGPMSRSDAARIAGRRSAEVRRERYGSAQPLPNEPERGTNQPNAPPNQAPRSSEQRSERQPSQPPERQPSVVRTPDPVPEPEPDLAKEESERAKDLTGQRAKEPPGAPSLAPIDWTDTETICPTDLRERAEANGVLRELSDKLNVPLESVDDAAREFVGYWIVGKGAGQRRRNWMAKLREHIRRAHREHRLRAPGEIQHDPQSGGGDPEVEAIKAKLAAMPER